MKRFWDKVKRTAGCWLWTAYTRPNGYGEFSPNGRGSNMLAHRFSWEMENGPIPDGLCVLHKCDTPACVNPAHLFLGSQADNMTDRMVKGRAPAGKRHWNYHGILKRNSKGRYVSQSI